MKSIRVLLADDHKLIRAGLALVVEQQPDLSVVGEADDGRQAVEMVKSLKPDVVVMDIGMPNLNGIEAARQMSEIRSDTSVVHQHIHRGNPPGEDYAEVESERRAGADLVRGAEGDHFLKVVSG